MDFGNTNSEYVSYKPLEPISLIKNNWTKGIFVAPTIAPPIQLTENEAITRKAKYNVYISAEFKSTSLGISISGGAEVILPPYAKLIPFALNGDFSTSPFPSESHSEETYNKLGNKLADKLLNLQSKIGSDLFNKLKFDQKILMADTVGGVSLPAYVSSKDISSNIEG
jgi:hypothetical protein